MKDVLFSIILLHYNQMEFIENAIDSILTQDYGNIELIIADDCSSVYNEKHIHEYIEENKKDNLKSIILQTNKENLGTIKNLNAAIKKSTGTYLMFFAADDELYDRKTITNFAEALEELGENDYILSGQCEMYDENLEKKLSSFVDASFAGTLNGQPSEEQYKVLMFDNIYAIGATAFKSKLFKVFSDFDERYKIIEDWSFFLKATRNGYKIIYRDFLALKHRDGGVSNHQRTKLPPHVINFWNDLLRITEFEILPYLSMVPDNQKIALINKYEGQRKELEERNINGKRKKRIHLIKENPKIYIKLFLWFLIRVAPNFMRKQLKVTIFSGSIWCFLAAFKNLFQITAIQVSLSKMMEVSFYGLLQNIVLIVFCISTILLCASGMLTAVYGLKKTYKKYFRG